MTKRFILCVLSAATMAASPAFAGEVSGNGKDLPVNGRSICDFSGRNDTPEGLWLPIGPGGTLVQVDPGGDVQSYGAFKKIGFLGSPSDPANRQAGFPGASCNPNGSGGE